MSVDYHALLWQQLNKTFATGTDQAFVMATGKFLLYSDYSLLTSDNVKIAELTSDNVKIAEYNTFQLTDVCVACSPNYNPTGSNISVLWDQLLNDGQGPQAGPEQQAAFEQAKRSLFKVWEARTPTPFYQSYIDANDAYQKKEIKIKSECQKEYGDQWEAIYNEVIKATSEYLNFERLDKEVAPMLKAINNWIYGPLAYTLVPMKKAFDNNKRGIVLPDGKKQNYMYVLMAPSNWYQWFDPNQLDDPAWITITVDENSFDATQDSKYKKLGGYVDVGYDFLGIKAGGEGSQEKKISTGDSRGIKISFKVRSVQINRRWLDPSALKIQKWVVPGLAPGAWSTGILDKSNTGSFPLLSTQMIVAKDIKVTADKFSQEITDSLKKFDAKVGVGIIYGLFSFGGGVSGGYAHESHSFHFDAKRSSITLEGAQVIGCTGTLMPKYPV